MEKTCKRCGNKGYSWPPFWTFKSGDSICDACHDECMWWLFVRDLMYGKPEIEVPSNRLKETT